MFFSLVKKSVTEEEKRQIFAKSNQMEAKRQKRRKKWKEGEERRKREVEYKARRQLKHFRKELVGDQQFGHPPDRNMAKRGLRQGRENLELDYVDLDNPSQLEDGEIIEGWRNFCDDDHDDFLSHVSIYEQESQSQTVDEMDLGEDKRSGGEIEGVAASRRKDTRGGVSLEEKMAADQFEKTDECELNFGIDL